MKFFSKNITGEGEKITRRRCAVESAAKKAEQGEKGDYCGLIRQAVSW